MWCLSLSEEFTTMVAERVNSAIDISDLEDEKDRLESNLRSLKKALKQREFEMDHINYDEEPDTVRIKEERLQSRIESLYRDISKSNNEIKSIEAKIAAIQQAKYKEKQIFDILKNFSVMYSTLDDEEKRTCMQLLIESIEIQNYDTKVIDYSKLISNITFRFYLSDNPNELTKIYRTNEKHDETVVLLSRKMPDIHIDIDVDVDELVQDKRGIATYAQIKDYVLKQTGLNVSTLYISQVKRKFGIDVGEAFNKPKSSNSRQPQCPKEKEKAIIDALKHYNII